MAIERRIASLNFRELVVLCLVFLRRPQYLIPTYKATNRAVEISDRLYGDLHHEDNRTNAFRHALWNYLICQYCLPVAGCPERVMSWSKKITDLHERLAPNEDLAKMMDLHNNKIGRELFLNFSGKEMDILTVLQQMTAEAVQVKSPAEIEEEQSILVFIEKIKR
ncbi:DUF6973 domain-containing protein [Salinimicrobium xinjiangense]|uniref:DUF6973 domain-containing protein n=1 Tax=Salinimicrobium xinjiangense TaxID=438596 RepID=UPI00049068EE|nr:hypothetical protein [Salinimicrobium xinjiangense]